MGQQANSGTRFIVVSLAIANPTSSDVHASPPDYIRLQAGTMTIAPEGSTSIPIDITANTTNTTGTAAFLVPQNETAFTLILLAGTSTGASSQATIAFQIQ